MLRSAKILSVVIVCLLATYAASHWPPYRVDAYEDDHAIRRMYYYFESIRRIGYDYDKDGTDDLVERFTFLNPYVIGTHGPCVYPDFSTKADRNLDGKWDTWVDGLGCAPRDGYVQRVRADTTGDGIIDMELVVSGKDEFDRIWGSLPNSWGLSN